MQGEKADRLTPYYWEQQPGETDAAYLAFEAYRDLGPSRNVTQAYRVRYDKPDATQPNGTFREWAKRFEWKDRAQSFDLYVRRQQIQAFLGLSLNEHLDGLRTDAVTTAEKMLRVAEDIGDGLARVAKKWLEHIQREDYTPTATDVRVLSQVWQMLSETGMNVKGAAVGVHQLLGMLTGDTPLDLGGGMGTRQDGPDATAPGITVTRGQVKRLPLPPAPDKP